ncbi:hypothetical protein DIPPA_26161 [Diplonema papillatum]|nr:hypothetical protein DIPPA_26161 [Diplonema papillatum]
MGEGEWQKTFTLITIVIHFVHPLLCVANYLDWVRHEEEELGSRTVNLYLAATIIATLMYLMVASVFYMWAYRWPLPEEYAQKRRIYGVIVNLLFSDVPLFAIEVDIIWKVGGFVAGIQGACFLFTCLSFAYSGIRTWIYLMITVIKATHPRHHGGVAMPGHMGGGYAGGGGIGGGYGITTQPYQPQNHDYDLRRRDPSMSQGGLQMGPTGGVPTGAIGGRSAAYGGGGGYGASPFDYNSGGGAPGMGYAAGGIVPQSRPVTNEWN